MSRRALRGMTRARLRWTLGVLLVLLALPSAILVVQTLRQLKWEAIHQQRELAEELAARIDLRLQQLIAIEEARSVADYGFLTVANVDAALLQRSPLAQFPVASELPGLLGWFQVDAAGVFSSPLLPDDEVPPERFGLGADELVARRALADQLLTVLSQHALATRRAPASPPLLDADAEREADAPLRRDMAREVVAPAPAAPAIAEFAPAEPAAVAAQSNFDQLSARQLPQAAGGRALGKVVDLKLQEPLSAPPAEEQRAAAKDDDLRSRRKESGARPQLRAEASAPGADAAVASSNLPGPAQVPQAKSAAAGPSNEAKAESAPRAAPLRIFDSELDPFEFAPLGSSHFVLYRRVWQNGERSVQGALIEQSALIRGALAAPFADSAVASVSDLLVAWQGEVIEKIDGRTERAYTRTPDPSSGTLLHRARLSAPLADLELIWTLRTLPTSPASSLVAWAGALLFAVLFAGFFALYRLGLRQLALAAQQQNFIAAVSHELKTPLTSIRMYGELLRAGWASEDKKREYYDFIFDESERLSRLIANVLQLARFERDALALALKPVTAATLFDLLRSKLASQIERAGFEPLFELEPSCAERVLQVDADALVQVMINLVDNALKFAARADIKRVEIRVSALPRGGVQFAVRDFGPGVPPALQQKIFELFFRAGTELTRETQGTGIGLALVQQLVTGMGGSIAVEARQPGVEFGVRLGA